MAGQVAYHLIAQAGMTRAPWAITTIVSCRPAVLPSCRPACLPVLVLGTALAHMLRADAEVMGAPNRLLCADRNREAPPPGSATIIVSPKPAVDPNGIKEAEQHVHVV
jgi:hypothetical protein